MPFSLIIGAGGGLASAVLFFSAARGAPWLSTLLLLLTPLPTLLAGLGWGWLPAVAGAVTGALAIGALASLNLAGGFLLSLGVPAALIAYLAYLSRPDPEAPGDPDRREWYPAGRLLAALTLYGGALPVLVLPLIGGSYDILRAPVRELLSGVTARTAPELGMKPPTPQQIEAISEMITTAIPAAFSGYWVAIMALNLYLAGRIARLSGLLARDWPDLPGLTFPRGFPVLLVLALLATWTSGIVATLGIGLTGAILIAYLFGGLALTHFLARGRAPWLLWLVYAAVLFVQPYAAIVLILIGLAEPLFKLRQRFGPPLPPPSS